MNSRGAVRLMSSGGVVYEVELVGKINHEPHHARLLGSVFCIMDNSERTLRKVTLSAINFRRNITN